LLLRATLSSLSPNHLTASQISTMLNFRYTRHIQARSGKSVVTNSTLQRDREMRANKIEEHLPLSPPFFCPLIFLISKQTWWRLLSSSSSSSSTSTLCRVLIRIFLRQTMSLGNTVLQLFCCYYS